MNLVNTIYRCCRGVCPAEEPGPGPAAPSLL